MTELVPLVVLVFAAALLYSSVGHAGASGYLAAMAHGARHGAPLTLRKLLAVVLVIAGAKMLLVR